MVIEARFCDCVKNLWIINFRRLNFMVYELYFNKALSLYSKWLLLKENLFSWRCEWQIQKYYRKNKCITIWEIFEEREKRNYSTCSNTCDWCCLVTKSRLTLLWPHGLWPLALSMGFPRHEYWEFTSPGDLSDPRIKLRSPAWAGRLAELFTTEPPGRVCNHQRDRTPPPKKKKKNTKKRL